MRLYEMRIPGQQYRPLIYIARDDANVLQEYLLSGRVPNDELSPILAKFERLVCRTLTYNSENVNFILRGSGAFEGDVTIHELKKGNHRMAFFVDGCFLIVVHCFYKDRRRTNPRDIAIARTVRNQYFLDKRNEDIQITR